MRRLLQLANAGGSAPTADMRATMNVELPARIPLDPAAYTLKVAGYDDWMADPGTRLVDLPTVRAQMRQRAGDITWRLALHLVQLPEVVQTSSSPASTGTIADKLEVATLRSSTATPTPVELSSAGDTHSGTCRCCILCRCMPAIDRPLSHCRYTQRR